MDKRLAVLIAAFIQGCASMGASDYACKGRPGKPMCISTSEVYEKTHDREALVRIEREEEEKADEEDSGTQGSAKIQAPPPPVGIAVEGIIPIRTPARVMRIWIAPWEDEEGDLIAPGFVFTEIEPRRWQIGLEKKETSSRVMEPLRSGRFSQGLEVKGVSGKAGSGAGKQRPVSRKPGA